MNNAFLPRPWHNHLFFCLFIRSSRLLSLIALHKSDSPQHVLTASQRDKDPELSFPLRRSPLSLLTDACPYQQILMKPAPLSWIQLPVHYIRYRKNVNRFPLFCGFSRFSISVKKAAPPQKTGQPFCCAQYRPREAAV